LPENSHGDVDRRREVYLPGVSDAFLEVFLRALVGHIAELVNPVPPTAGMRNERGNLLFTF
jgi:hypothetical protein